MTVEANTSNSKREAELILNPVLGDVCPVSMEYQKGWYMVSILVDSGAGESVAPPDAIPHSAD